MLVVVENKEFGDVIGSPESAYLNRLVHQGRLATRTYAITHPSLPSYLTLTSGSTHGIASDCTRCTVQGPNLASQLDGAGRPWRPTSKGSEGEDDERGAENRVA